ncbi:MAG: NADH-quinone oxidoreductase subunit J [SAR202 cluster bacterium]|nr:NADH-quinone oxidoreductase subunit J [SAR202 cluster bacterium]
MITPSLVLFYLAGALTLGGALGVVMSRNIVYAAIGLIVALLGVAGVFLLAFAEFLALVQILIYGGAIVIVVVFALMLTRLDEFRQAAEHKQWPLAALAAAAFFGVLAAGVARTAVATTDRTEVGFLALGEQLFTDWAVPFEVVSLVLLVALIGAVVMVRRTGERG